MGLYFVLQGAADLIYGLVQYFRLRDFDPTDSVQLVHFLSGVVPALIGVGVLAMSPALASWAYREDASDA
ncbi:MAG: hypothetical protein CMJ94_11440 [Planctomycetes bacterium]|nr:hypothetical protein [Planctomycetota bacterium]